LESVEDYFGVKGYRNPNFVQQILKYQSLAKNSDSSWLRNLLTRTLVWNPLQGDNPDELNLYILTSPKDIELLQYSLLSAIQSIHGSVNKINVVVPESVCAETVEYLEPFGKDYQVRILTDEELLKKSGLTRSDFSSTHVIMLTIKFLCALDSESENVLIYDGDTIFLRRRTWRAKNRILLVVSQEYLSRYSRYCRVVFGLRSDSGFGFITQSQLFLRSVVQAIVNQVGSSKELALNFEEHYSKYQIDSDINIFPVDWQLHADWVIERTQLEPIFATYSNLSMSRQNLIVPLTGESSLVEIESKINLIRECVPKLGSLSLHAFKT
jgi:hypothetical protein